MYKAPKKVSGFWSPHASPQTSTSALLIFLFFAMKLCPIAAKISGSIRILPCCVLKRLFHIGVGLWRFARFVRPLLATILCNWKFGPPRVSRISLSAKKTKKITKKKHLTLSRHPFWSQLMTRNGSLFYLPNRLHLFQQDISLMVHYYVS